MMSLREKFTSGAYSKEDVELAESLMQKESWEDVNDFFVPYLKHVEKPNMKILLDVARNSRSPYLCSETIKCLRYRREKFPELSSLIYNFLDPMAWDPYHDVLVAALNASAYYLDFDDNIKSKLAASLHSGDEMVRDGAVMAAQIYANTPSEQLVYSEGDGSLISRVGALTKEWITMHITH